MSTGRFCQSSLLPAREQLPPRRVRQRLTGGETVGEARAHHARERRDEHALAEVELRDGGVFLCRRELVLLRDSRAAADRNSGQRGEDAEQDDLTRSTS